MTATIETLSTARVAEVPFPLSVGAFILLCEHGLIPYERRVFLWDGRLYEKVAKTRAHAAVHDAFNRALSRRLPPGLFVGNERPVQLDAAHLPLPDLVVLRGNPLDFYDTRYPDGRDVLLVVEVAVSSLPQDLGRRLDRFARTLPLASYVVANVLHRRLLIHTGPRAEGDPAGGGYESCTVVSAGEAMMLKLGDLDLEPIPYDEVMR